MSHTNASRRLFMRQLGAFSLLGTAAPLALNLATMGSAAAQSFSDYKALVCVFLYGGNDHFNTVLATDTSSWNNYSAARGSLALPGLGQPGGVLPITPTIPHAGRSFALNPHMAALQTLFNGDGSAGSKRLAIMSNVGPLVVPLADAAAFASATATQKPKSLFSHNDQQNVWQSLKPEGVTSGWGGQLADSLVDVSDPKSTFTSISPAGNAVWLSGQNVRQYQVGVDGAVRMPHSLGGRHMLDYGIMGAMESIAGTHYGSHLLERDLATVSKRSRDAEAALRDILSAQTLSRYGVSSDLIYDVPNHFTNSLAQQLRTVARMIDAGKTMGVKRQVFMVSLGGFDTHAAQATLQPALLTRVAHGLKYFDTVLGNMGARNQVTTFTASDFGRALISNGSGTDHGWGAHHFIMGGAQVKGGLIHGTFPTLGTRNSGTNTFSSSDQLDNGMLLPRASVDQYGNTLGQWLGVSESNRDALFQNLANFSSAKDLGFMDHLVPAT